MSVCYRTAVRLLDLPLDQLIEGSDVGGLLDLPSSLVVLKPRPETRRINFVVGAVLAQERCWSGSPQIHEGSISLRLLPSRFVLPLRLCLGALEGGDLRLELVVELLQRHLFTNDVLTVESRLLPVAI